MGSGLSPPVVVSLFRAACHATIGTITMIVTPRVRSVSRDDLSALVRALEPDPAREQLLHRIEEVESGTRSMLVAVVRDIVVGTVSFQHFDDQPVRVVRLFALDVGMRWRRKGVGSILVEAIELQAEKLGARSVSLEVAVDNLPAIELYRKLGYRQDGEVFVNQWERFTSLGPVTVEEPSVRMIKTLDC